MDLAKLEAIALALPEATRAPAAIRVLASSFTRATRIQASRATRAGSAQTASASCAVVPNQACTGSARAEETIAPPMSAAV